MDRRRCSGGEQRQEEGTQKPQPVEQEAEVIADGGKHGVVGVALGEGQEVAAHAVVVLEMADDGFDGGPASQRPFDGLGEATLVAGDSAAEIAIAKPRCQCDRYCPEAEDHNGGGAANGALPCKSGGSSVLRHDFWRDHFHHGQNAERQE